MGDPAGVGPEICLRLLANADLARECVPVIFGDAGVLRRVAEQLGLRFDVPVLAQADWPRASQTMNAPAVLNLQWVDAAAVTPGQVDARCGDAAFRYVIAAIEAGLKGEVNAITTAPLNKEALHAAAVHALTHVDVALLVGHDVRGGVELPAEVAALAEPSQNFEVGAPQDPDTHVARVGVVEELLVLVGGEGNRVHRAARRLREDELLLEERAIALEDLDAVVAAVRHVDDAIAGDCEAPGSGKARDGAYAAMVRAQAGEA